MSYPLPIGYCTFSRQARYGFVLPILSGKRKGELFFQAADTTLAQRPQLFAVEADIEFIRAQPLINEFVPEELNIGFLFPDGGYALGPKLALQTRIRKFCASHASDAALNLQLAELWGASSERVTARMKMIRTLRVRCGNQAGDWFSERALPQSVMWDLISHHSRVSTDKEVLYDLRAKAVSEVDVNSEGLLPSGTWQQLYQLLGINRDDIAAQFWQECPFISRREGENQVSREGTLADFKRPSQLSLDVRALGRQEQRIGRILAGAVEDRINTLEFLRTYVDRGTFGNDAIRVIKEELTNARAFDLNSEWVVAKIVLKLFTICYPMQRGVLLFDLASLLGQFPVVADAIRNKTYASRSIYVRQAQGAILSVLDSSAK
ncbi:MAG TPA: hypothetical protein VGA98_08685 [Allosphingosinicella sp.]